MLLNGDVFGKYRGKFLQLHRTVEDEGVFPPLIATLTCVPGRDQIWEGVCADNRHEFYNNKKRMFHKRRSRTSERQRTSLGDDDGLDAPSLTSTT